MTFDPTRPKWVQIADVIRSRIASGEYPPHHLISEAQMEREFGVARVTVRKGHRSPPRREPHRHHPGHGLLRLEVTPGSLAGAPTDA
ncbi:GntR family transcriptional regulator [Streptomyces ochraceiscleroticus]|uniref:GntR family transcriptional regulator n=1 Tax=Streptomyces ochraceiscleroticus TaxID=47761 RepID=A0ABW1MP94_9ACTN